MRNANRPARDITRASTCYDPHEIYSYGQYYTSFHRRFKVFLKILFIRLGFLQHSLKT